MFQSPWTHFAGLGMGESIPIYLRFSGNVQNISLSKKEVARIIDEVWIDYEIQQAAMLEQQRLALKEKENAKVLASLDPYVLAINGYLPDETAAPADNVSGSGNSFGASASTASVPTFEFADRPLFSQFFLIFLEVCSSNGKWQMAASLC